MTYDEVEGLNVNEQENKWQLDKHVPLSLIIAMAAQTLTFAWWLSMNLSEFRTEIRGMSHRIEEIWRDRYTKEDARRDQEFTKLRDEELVRRTEDLERRMRYIEGRVK